MTDQSYRDQLATARKLAECQGARLTGTVMRQIAAALDAAVATADDQLAAPTVEPETVWHLELFVAGRAAPQGSKHARPIFKGRGAAKVFTGKVVNVESSKSGVDAWRGDVRTACLTAWAGQAPLDGPLVLEVEFIRKRPAGAPKSYTPDANTQPDLSKLVRSTEDAITSAGVWADDGRVVRTVSSKRCAEIGEVPGAHIRIGRRTPARELWLAAKEAQKNGPSDRPGASQPPPPVPVGAEPPHGSDAHSGPTGTPDFWASLPGQTPGTVENGAQMPLEAAK